VARPFYMQQHATRADISFRLSVHALTAAAGARIAPTNKGRGHRGAPWHIAAKFYTAIQRCPRAVGAEATESLLHMTCPGLALQSARLVLGRRNARPGYYFRVGTA
jgi:hypothetical protein